MSTLSIAPDSLALLGEKLPLARAPIEVRKGLEGLCESDGRVLLACSGGADSVALTCWTWWHFPALRVDGRLCLAHVHHGLRGSAADDDAAFVERLGAALGLHTEVRRFDASTDASEADLREDRHQRLQAIAREERRRAILFGHQADDVLENLLFRLARGSSVSGLAGLRPVQRFSGRPVHLRPLIRVAREELEAALTAAGLPWREDASNQTGTYTRNRLRLEVVPAIESAFPRRDLRRAAAKVHEQLGELDQLVDSLADEWMAHHVAESGSLPRKPLEQAPAAVRRRVLEKWTRGIGAERFPRGGLAGLLAALGSDREGEWQASDRNLLVLDCDFLQVVPADRAVPQPWTHEPLALRPGSSLKIEEGRSLRAQVIDLAPPRLVGILAGEVDPETEAFLAVPEEGYAGLVVRAWKPGDTFRTMGAPGRRKVQDCFTDRGVPPATRHRLPVVCSKEGEILWIPGFPPAESRRLSASAGRALWLTYPNA